uniref:Uncharacterized protein n=1 Tax=Ascaris lumbricoides TaxID=6252 RepID=A0A0M3HTZ7_ASCLU
MISMLLLVSFFALAASDIADLPSQHVLRRFEFLPLFLQTKYPGEIIPEKRVSIKERRAPIEGFEDFDGIMRSLDGLQKPRYDDLNDSEGLEGSKKLVKGDN